MSKSSGLLKLSDVPSLLADLRYPELPNEQGLLMPDVMRLDAEAHYKSFIRKVIHDGQLVQRSHAGKPISSKSAVWNAGYVLRADLQQLLIDQGIQIQLDNAPGIESNHQSTKRLRRSTPSKNRSND